MTLPWSGAGNYYFRKNVTIDKLETGDLDQQLYDDAGRSGTHTATFRDSYYSSTLNESRGKFGADPTSTNREIRLNTEWYHDYEKDEQDNSGTNVTSHYSDGTTIATHDQYSYVQRENGKLTSIDFRRNTFDFEITSFRNEIEYETGDDTGSTFLWKTTSDSADAGFP